jgi:DNA-binding transcriptional LysR family regulator
VLLTLHGERLLGHARTILRHHDAAMADISGTGLSGTLRFGCPDDYAAAFLPHILRSFAGRHPQVFVEVFCAPTPRLVERLRKHALDLALISTTEADETARVIRREPLVWVGNQHDDAVAREPLQLALSDPDTLDHRAACASLDAARRPYRVAYASGSIFGPPGRRAFRPGHRGPDPGRGAGRPADPRAREAAAVPASRGPHREVRSPAPACIGGGVRGTSAKTSADAAGNFDLWMTRGQPTLTQPEFPDDC